MSFVDVRKHIFAHGAVRKMEEIDDSEIVPSDVLLLREDALVSLEFFL